MARPARVVREGLLQGPRRAGDGHRQGDPARLPQAGQAAPPRRQPGASEERFKEISAAYDVLGDAAKRKEYDEVRRLGPMAGRLRRPGAGGRRLQQRLVRRRRSRRPLRRPVQPRRGGAARRHGRGPQRGADLEAELHLSFLDAVNGVTTTVNLTSDAPAARATARAPRRARARRSARSAAAAASSTRTRVCSRSASPARRAGAAAS